MTPREVASRIDAAATAIEAELGTMPDVLASWHPAEGEWCVKEVLAHLVQSERLGFAGRVREILAADEPPLKATPEVPPACGENLEQLLARFREQRATSVELVAGLKPADLERGGIHERVGRLTINDLLHEWVHHDRAHQKQILSNVQAFVWPEMGGAQAFSQ
ncbi:MAG: DinB family protein [Chloroflexi bacterium]|nr:MAG: DinB family protein [Chloroflexota bacterium]